MSTPTKKPAYWIALVPLLLGLGTCAGSFLSLSGKIKDMPRVKVPGESTITLSAGEHTGFLETKSVVDGEVVSGSPSGRCNIKSADTGAPVAIEAVGSSTSYAFGSYAGESVMSVKIPTTGSYVVSCTSSGDGALAFGSGVGVLIILAVVGGLVGFGISVFLAWRVRKRRKLFDANAAQGRTGGGPPPAGVFS